MANPNGTGIVTGKPLTPIGSIPTKVRKDPLGAVTVNMLFENASWAQNLYLREHKTTGAHNALEVAREVGIVTYVAGAYGVAGQSASAFITSVNKQAVGQCRVRFNTAMFSSADLRDDATFALSATGNGCESKPQMVLYTIVDADEIDVFIWQLSSALGGAGNNTWALVDDGFAIAAFAKPVTATVFTNGSLFTPHQKGVNLGATNASWQAIVKSLSDLRYAFTQKHTTAGEHAAQEIARGQAHVKWNGAAYSFVENSGLFIACNTISTGIAELTFDARSSTNYEVFLGADYARNNGGAATDQYVICCPKSAWTTTAVRAYMYKYDAVNNSWSHADSDFYLSLHAP